MSQVAEMRHVCSDGAAETTQTLVQESTAEDLADALVALLDDFLAVEQSFSGQRLDAANMLLLTKCRTNRRDPARPPPFLKDRIAASPHTPAARRHTLK